MYLCLDSLQFLPTLTLGLSTKDYDGPPYALARQQEEIDSLSNRRNTWNAQAILETLHTAVSARARMENCQSIVKLAQPLGHKYVHAKKPSSGQSFTLLLTAKPGQNGIEMGPKQAETTGENHPRSQLSPFGSDVRLCERYSVSNS